MAARAGSARARRDTRRQGSTKRDSSRRRAGARPTRPHRSASDVVRPAAPVAPTLASGSAFLGAHHKLDLSGIPATLLVGTPLGEARERTYTALFDHGILPSVDVREDDTVAAVIERALKALAQQYDGVPFGLHLTPLDRLRFDELDDLDVKQAVLKQNPICAIVQVDDGWTNVDAVEYEAGAPAVDREACGALFERLRRATHFTFEAVTPGWSQDIAEWLLFSCEPSEWWEEKRGEIAAEIGHEPTGLELRRYVRENEIRTPGYVKRELGAHHARATRTRNLLSHERIIARLAGAPKPLRTATTAFLTEIAKLEKINRQLRAAQTDNEAAVLRGFGSISPTPGLIIETNGNGLVTEILNDSWQYASQDNGFSPNLCVLLDSSARSCKRLKRTLDAVSAATDAVIAIIDTLTTYEQTCYEHKGHDA